MLTEADIVSTRAVRIEAPPEAVWPWLAQMGSGRGGLYTYDWIENLLGLHMHSVEVVLPQFQNVAVGDAQKLGKRGPTLRIAICDLGRVLVVRSDDGNWVWSFFLERSGSGDPANQSQPDLDSRSVSSGPLVLSVLHGAGEPRNGTQDAARHQTTRTAAREGRPQATGYHHVDVPIRPQLTPARTSTPPGCGRHNHDLEELARGQVIDYQVAGALVSPL